LLNREAQTSAQIYNVVDDQPLLQSECYAWLAKTLNRTLPPTRKSEQPRKRGNTNKRVSNVKLHQLGWRPVYPTFVDAMERSVLASFAEAISSASD
jgi:hypothetical protein